MSKHYPRLTKEQFEALHQEFAEFLATHQITAEDWSKLKAENPDAAESLLDVFSKIVWEKVLQKAQYLEHISKHQWVLFKFENKLAHAIILKTKLDCTLPENRDQLLAKPNDYIIESFRSQKSFDLEAQQEKLGLIRQGAQICPAEAYEYFDQIISHNFNSF